MESLAKTFKKLLPLSPRPTGFLLTTSEGPLLTEYRVSKTDVAGPFLHDLPTKLEKLKDLKFLGFQSAREGLAEKFHMSEELLSLLNPRANFSRVGEQITVVALRNAEKRIRVVRIDVDKGRQTVSAYASADELVAFYPASVGSDEKPSPRGTLKVEAIQLRPTYRYDPEYRFKGVRTRKSFTIRPGPNNPVGSIWIGLSEQGYGLHGTPNPGKVSKSESHGCIRLTNWDAERLASMLKRGVPVNFIEAK